MRTVRLKGKVDSEGHLKLDIQTPLKAGDVEVVVVIESKTESHQKYDFSDISGKLDWKGDAVESQRALRLESQ